MPCLLQCLENIYWTRQYTGLYNQRYCLEMVITVTPMVFVTIGILVVCLLLCHVPSEYGIFLSFETIITILSKKVHKHPLTSNLLSNQQY